MAESLVWDDVRLFLVLYRARTMTEAAARLGVNASTASRRLVQLEEALDMALFERGRNGLRPTPAADNLLPTAEIAEQGVHEFASVADSLERDVAGVVRMTCPSDVADVIVLPILQRLFKRHPELRVALDPGEAMVDLNRHEADLALRVVRPTRGDLVVKHLLSVEWQPATSAALAARLRPVRNLSELPWIGWGERLRNTPASRWLEEHACADPVLRTDSLNTHIAAAKAGLGVALVPAPSVEHYRLTALPLPRSTPSVPRDDLFLLTHRTLRSVPRIRVVWDAIMEHFEAFTAR